MSCQLDWRLGRLLVGSNLERIMVEALRKPNHHLLRNRTLQLHKHGHSEIETAKDYDKTS